LRTEASLAQRAPVVNRTFQVTRTAELAWLLPFTSGSSSRGVIVDEYRSHYFVPSGSD